jgi:hypothetical protein
MLLHATGLSDLYEVRRGEDLPLSFAPTVNGAAVDLDVVTVSVSDPTGAVVSSGAAAVAGGVATYTLLASVTADRDPGTGWIVEWSYLVDGEPIARKVRNPLDVVLYTVEPVIGWSDLLGRHADLAERNASGDKAYAQIRDAWLTIKQRLRSRARRPCLIVDSYALREVHLLLSLAFVWRGLATGGSETQEGQDADRYEAQFERLWETLTFEEADPATYRRTGDRKSTRGTLWLGSTGTGQFREQRGLR